MVGLLEYDISISIPVSLPVYTQCKPLPLNWLRLGATSSLAWLSAATYLALLPHSLVKMCILFYDSTFV